MCKRTMYKRARIPMFLWERRACANSGESNKYKICCNISSEISWLHLWDIMLEQGHEGTVALQAFFKVATWPNIQAISTCPSCKESTDTLFSHFITTHLQKTTQDIKQLLLTGNARNIFLLARRFHLCSSSIT